MKTQFIASLLLFLFLFSCSHYSPNSIKRIPSSDKIGVSCVDILKKYFTKRNGHLFEEAFEKYSSHLSRKEKEEVFRTIDSLYFIDHRHTITELHEVAVNGKTLSRSDMEYRYNAGEYTAVRYEKGDPEKRGFFKKLFNIPSRKKIKELKYKENALGGYRKANDYLLEEKPPINMSTFKKVQSILMDGGVEGLDDSKLGKFRVGGVYGNEVGTRGLTHQQAKNINDNQFTYFEQIGGENRNGRLNGKIWYPNSKNVQDKTLDFIADDYAALVSDIKRFQQNNVGDQEELTLNLVNALSENVLKWFTREKDQIGPIDNIKAFKKYARLAAEFQRNLVSIHPFRNGNGRTTRSFALYYPFIKEGLPPPRLSRPGADLYDSLDEWAKQVQEGVIASAGLYEDLVLRARLGLRIEDSPELLTPNFRREVFLRFIKQGRKDVEVDLETPVHLDSRQFLAFYKYFMKENPEYVSKLETDTEGVFKAVGKAYDRFVNNNKIFFLHKKKGKEMVGLNFVDNDFIRLFGKNLSHDKKKWDLKMDLWYKKRVNWRGLCSLHNEVKEGEVIGMFTNFHHHVVSENVKGKMTRRMSSKKLREIIIDDFKRYNDDLYHNDSGGLVEMATDHLEIGPRYRTSWGFSTSKNHGTGKRFGMGHMVLGDEGQYKDPEMQKRVKARVNVGVRESFKDVDTTRLKQLRNKFSNGYGRQEEVMGTGASDPDSVMVVQLMDPEGNITASYVRNSDRPWEIWKFGSDIREANNDTPKDTLLGIINLRK